jgi:hypothetical protein
VTLSLVISSNDHWSTCWSEQGQYIRRVATLESPSIYAQGLDKAWRVFATDGREVFTFLPSDHPARRKTMPPLYSVTTRQVVRDCGLAS